MTFGERAVALSGLAMRALGWRPDHFWTATPAELAAAFSDPAVPAAPLDRGELTRLMEHDDARLSRR